MKNFYFYIGGGLALVLVAGSCVYKIIKARKQKVNDFLAGNGDFIKKNIDVVSYECLMDEAKQLIGSIDRQKLQTDVLSVAVIPTELAKDFYAKAKVSGALQYIDLTDDERERMIVLSIQSNETVIKSEIIVAAQFTDDYHDVVPEDKIYFRKIKIAF